MLIPFQEILAILPQKPEYILHIGAHLAEELPIYQRAGISDVFWVEPNPELFDKVKEKVGGSNCIRLAVSDQINHIVDFHRVYSKDKTNMGCSSILKPTKMLDNPHLKQIDTIQVRTTTVDMINEFFGPFDFCSIDIQGAEMLALKGAKSALEESLRGLLIEFTTVSFYENDCKLQELDEYLQQFGFERKITSFATDEQNWGDALWVKVGLDKNENI